VAHLRAIAAASGALGERAREVLCCLREPVVAEVEDRPRRTTPLPADVVERRLRRGLGTDDPSLGERFKTWVAKERRPDPKMLQHYCERVMRADAPIVRIVDEAATLLGLGHVDIYVSRGDDDVGVRAFPAARPFVLVGGQHLDAAATYAMTPNELRLAVGAELLHLRVGNVRVGTRDVMRGALHKGRTGLDLALGVLPLLRGLKLADRLGVLTAKVSLPQVSKALESARGAIDGESTSEAHGLSPAAEKLLEAQRNLQLWADRAGLLCAGSFGAAVRAMAITRHDTSRVARELARAGVLEVIEKQRPSDPEAMEYLLLRVAALAAFYVSFDHSAPSVAAAVQAS
jgi:hypothetical protein